MWNAYPDLSQGVFGTGLFYNGSMIVTLEMKWEDVLRQKNWMNLDKLDSKGGKRKDAEVIKFWGNVYTPRS